MSDELRDVMCLRCNAEMVLDTQPYAIPYAIPRGTENKTVSLEGSRIVRLYRCPNDECLSVELKIPAGWPTIVPKTP